jgi:hypothetical protein
MIGHVGVVEIVGIGDRGHALAGVADIRVAGEFGRDQVIIQPGRHPHMVLPRNDVAVLVDAPGQFLSDGRPLGLLTMLVPARPLHAHRLVDRLRHQRRVHDHMLEAIITISARGLEPAISI